MRPFTNQKIYSLVFMYFKSMGASKMHRYMVFFQFLGISKNREKATLKSIFLEFFTPIVNLEHFSQYMQGRAI